jgi:hypothetical protein
MAMKEEQNFRIQFVKGTELEIRRIGTETTNNCIADIVFGSLNSSLYDCFEVVH